MNSPTSKHTLLAPQNFGAFVAILLALFCLPTAYATPVCRWVDGGGRTQMSDVVPDQYKKSATCTDSQNYELSQAQKREAQQRAAEVKNRAQRDATVTPMPAASSPSGATGELPLPIEKRPRELITDATDCQTQWRIYDESIACFGPYRTARGATKPEGYDYCNVIASPELKCGPPTR